MWWCAMQRLQQLLKPTALTPLYCAWLGLEPARTRSRRTRRGALISRRAEERKKIILSRIIYITINMFRCKMQETSSRTQAGPRAGPTHRPQVTRVKCQPESNATPHAPTRPLAMLLLRPHIAVVLALVTMVAFFPQRATRSYPLVRSAPSPTSMRKQPPTHTSAPSPSPQARLL